MVKEIRLRAKTLMGRTALKTFAENKENSPELVVVQDETDKDLFSLTVIGKAGEEMLKDDPNGFLAKSYKFFVGVTLRKTYRIKQSRDYTMEVL
jgi:hypothetical protein